MNDVQAQIHEVSRKRDESMHALDVVQREREHAADNERLKMHGKIAEIAEEVSKKILSKEIRLREEAQQKFSNIEKVRNGIKNVLSWNLEGHNCKSFILHKFTLDMILLF